MTIPWYIPTLNTVDASNIGDNRIVVLTGMLTHRFQFQNGVSQTGDRDLVYKQGTFSTSAGRCYLQDRRHMGYDQSKEAFDTPRGLHHQDGNGDTSRGRFNYNLTPINGSDVTGMSGLLCSFELTGTPGTYTQGFQNTNPVDRTYYGDRDASGMNYYQWGSYMADALGELTPGVEVDNTIAFFLRRAV